MELSMAKFVKKGRKSTW